MLVVCERWVGDGDRLLFLPKVLLATIAALLSHLGWVVLRAQSSLSATGSHAGILSPTGSSRLCPGYIFVWCPPTSAVPPLIYTGASLDWWLGRGSICWRTPSMKLLQPHGCWRITVAGSEPRIGSSNNTWDYILGVASFWFLPSFWSLFRIIWALWDFAMSYCRKYHFLLTNSWYSY